MLYRVLQLYGDRNRSIRSRVGTAQEAAQVQFEEDGRDSSIQCDMVTYDYKVTHEFVRRRCAGERSVLLLAYGNSGTGKTTALLKGARSPVKAFITPRTTFKCLEYRKEGWVDLASPGPQGRMLNLREQVAALEDVSGEGLDELPADRLSEVLAKRRTETTPQNPRSSRSHLFIFMKDGEREIFVVDLAVSEQEVVAVSQRADSKFIHRTLEELKMAATPGTATAGGRGNMGVVLKALAAKAGTSVLIGTASATVESAKAAAIFIETLALSPVFTAGRARAEPTYQSTRTRDLSPRMAAEVRRPPREELGRGMATLALPDNPENLELQLEDRLRAFRRSVEAADRALADVEAVAARADGRAANVQMVEAAATAATTFMANFAASAVFGAVAQAGHALPEEAPAEVQEAAPAEAPGEAPEEALEEAAAEVLEEAVEEVEVPRWAPREVPRRRRRAAAVQQNVGLYQGQIEDLALIINRANVALVRVNVREATDAADEARVAADALIAATAGLETDEARMARKKAAEAKSAAQTAANLARIRVRLINDPESEDIAEEAFEALEEALVRRAFPLANDRLTKPEGARTKYWVEGAQDCASESQPRAYDKWVSTWVKFRCAFCPTTFKGRISQRSHYRDTCRSMPRLLKELYDE